MKLTSIVFIILVFSARNVVANGDTLYFSKDLKEIPNSQEAAFYGIRNYNKAKQGSTRYYYPNDTLYANQQEKKGKKNGVCTYFYENGEMEKNLYFKNNKYVNEQQYFDVSGVYVRSELYNFRHKLKAEFYTTESNKKVYFLSNRMAYFGNTRTERKFLHALGQFVSDNRPIIAVANDFEDPTVTVDFLIAPTGEIEEIKIINSIHPLLDNAAIEIIKKMPKWRPARHKGENVYSPFSLSIQF